MTDQIDILNADIFWHEEEGKVTKFAVLGFEADESAHPKYRSWDSSLGRHCAGWPYEVGNGPEGIFANFVLYDRLPTIEIKKLVLSELGKIQQAVWARRMLAEIEHETSEVY